MSSDILTQLRQIQQRAEQVAGSIRVARDALPAESVGWDPDRVASVQVDRAGSPVGIRVADGWARELAPDRLGSAVLQAGADAAAHQVRELAQILSDPAWQLASPDAAVPLAAEPAIAAPRAAPDSAPTPAIATAPTRGLDELAEAMIGELRSVRSTPATAAATPAGRGSAAGGAVVLMLGPAGLTSCEIDPDWAAGRSGIAVSLIASEALGAARTDLARAVFESAAATTGRRLDGMLAEAMAFLTEES